MLLLAGSLAKNVKKPLASSPVTNLMPHGEPFLWRHEASARRNLQSTGNL
jgi:hypothetical protein